MPTPKQALLQLAPTDPRRVSGVTNWSGNRRCGHSGHFSDSVRVTASLGNNSLPQRLFFLKLTQDPSACRFCFSKAQKKPKTDICATEKCELVILHQRPVQHFDNV